jgi:DNA-binding transcriptional LysR family regulator
MQWTDRIGRRVKLRDLHVFLAVAQAGSMAKAAEQLGVSQPVVSKTISDLEHALAIRLLDRNSRGVEPTTHGDAFINCSTAVFDEIRRGVQQLAFLSDPTVGELGVGCTTPLADGLIPAILERLAAACNSGERRQSWQTKWSASSNETRAAFPIVSTMKAVYSADVIHSVRCKRRFLLY